MSKRRPDPPGSCSLPPNKKRQKATSTTDTVIVKQQSSLLSFFTKKVEPEGVKNPVEEDSTAERGDNNNNNNNNKSNDGKESIQSEDIVKESSIKKNDVPAFKSDPPSSLSPTTRMESSSSSSQGPMPMRIRNESEQQQQKQQKQHDDNNHEPIIPQTVSFDTKNARWIVQHGCVMVRTMIKEEPRHKVAAFDIDGTLLVWRIAGWPSRLTDYELWNPNVISQLQQLYDTQGYKIVLFSNQGAIRSALQGKKATLIKSLVEWLAQSCIQRPVSCVISTDKKRGYHKPNSGMWNICQQHCNKGVVFDLPSSFYVGDSVGDDDPQGGVDEKFAKNIGQEASSVLAFHEPQNYFGPSTATQRKKTTALQQEYDAPPTPAAQHELAALMGGYLQGPILLILCGIQGSGKSTFCSQLLHGDGWVHLSQDTINKGKPGKRELVEEHTRRALQENKSVVVDRTHLTPEQRGHFVAIGKEFGGYHVKVHAVLLRPCQKVILQRVRNRTNHPGKVEGESGVKVVMAFANKLVVPKYAEGFDLVSCTGTDHGAERLSTLYKQVVTSSIQLPSSLTLSNGLAMPSIALGTMGLGKRKATDVVACALASGIQAFDTAPTYKNEEEVGKGLSPHAFVIVKVPKRVTQPEQVRDELKSSLANLGRSHADLLLLHWPCDVIQAGTLQSVWQAMEKCLEDGLCRALGVSNFSIDALRQLLPLCKFLPCVNQVERHLLLPQLELLQFCFNHDIVVQAHTALGQGKSDLLQNDAVLAVAKETGLTSAQVVLMWNLQHGVAVVPKCASEDHLQQAVAVLTGKVLTSHQMQTLDTTTTTRTRFVAPPFMYGESSYAWARRPQSKSQ